MEAADLLGSSHPLTRATRRFETACLQLLAGLMLLAGIVLFTHGPGRRAWLFAGIAICAVLGSLVASAWCTRRRRAFDVILVGDEDLPLHELEPVRRRLENPHWRSQLASSLDHCLRSAEQWHETVPMLRPVSNVRLLLPLQDDVRDIQRLLRADAVPRVRGVALCEQLLSDGVSSPLFGGDGEALRRELGRIRYALASA
jgi:hypothetical protein